MADWTDVVPAPFGCSYWSSYCGIHSIGAVTGTLGTPASATYPSANRAIYIPFRLMNAVRITKLWAYNGATANGNFDLGIYNADGVNLVSTGSTVQSGINAIQIVALGTPIRLGVGLFYMAIAASATTLTFFRVNQGTLLLATLGMALQNTAFPLPAAATFATYDAGGVYPVPVIGFISEEG